MMCKFKKGFTLAEMLLSIVIIGVISAIAIPSLRETTDMSSNIALLKKAHSTAANAFAQLQAELGPPMYWTVKNSGDESIENQRVFADGKYDRLSWVLKKKIVSTPNSIPNNYMVKILSGSNFGKEIRGTKIDYSGAFQSMDGMFWFPSKTHDGCQYEINEAPSPVPLSFFNFVGSPAYAAPPPSWKKTLYLCGMVMVDINGAKKPNRMGIDVFVFDITVDGVVPHSESTDDCANFDGNGYSCAKKAIYEGPKALSFIYE